MWFEHEISDFCTTFLQFLEYIDFFIVLADEIHESAASGTGDLTADGTFGYCRFVEGIDVLVGDVA